MKVSIIVPVYNVKDYLQRCLDSIISQTINDYEIIIVDDGSTDGSGEFVDRYKSTHENIKIVHKQNGGLMSAWTTGVKIAEGEYIGFVDSDDYIMPDMYHDMLSLAIINDADIVMCNYLINGKDYNTKIQIEDGLYEKTELYDKIFTHVFPKHSEYAISMARTSKLFKREIIISNLKYCESLSRTFEDRYITPAAILSCKSIYFTNKAYYSWMIRKGSNHGMYKKNLLDEIFRVYNVQHQVILDYMPSLESNWEHAFIDYIRLYFERNIVNAKGFNNKLSSARTLLNDKTAQQRVDKFKKELRGKTEMMVRIAFQFHNPYILALSSYLKK